MKHHLLDAESRLNKIYKDNNLDFYNLELSFADLIGRKRTHSHGFSVETSRQISDKISFTAISDVLVQTGIVRSISKDIIDVVVFGFGDVSVKNRQQESFKIGDKVYVFDHLDDEKDYKDLTKYIIKNINFDIDLLRLQFINADVLDMNGDTIIRMGVDPIYSRGYYVKTLEA